MSHVTTVMLSDGALTEALRHHLLQLSPRAFELFSGEFLTYVGLSDVEVTRYSGDGGIDAKGILHGGDFRLSVGIQVKRFSHNVQRPDIDRFIGAISGSYSHGIFVTTSGYAKSAIDKARHPTAHLSLMNGTQVVTQMLAHQVGVKRHVTDYERLDIDPDYFNRFEAQRHLFSRLIHGDKTAYVSDIGDTPAVTGNPQLDLISLRALSFALRLDPATVRRWLNSGKIIADNIQTDAGRDEVYFQRQRIAQFQQELQVKTTPSTGELWRSEFMAFVCRGRMNRSYKPVLLKAFFGIIDHEGKCHIHDLVRDFRAFYLDRHSRGLSAETSGSIVQYPETASEAECKELLITNPLERFLIPHYFLYDPKTSIVQVAPHLWSELRYSDVLEILTTVDSQLAQYYGQ